MNPADKFEVKAKVVVNCAGVFADEVSKMASEELTPHIVPSRGTHLIFSKGLLGENQGIIITETTDGRLLFMINYYGHPMVGTIDVFCDATHHSELS
jgi:glycerol-3-phosphate dehydrogenase